MENSFFSTCRVCCCGNRNVYIRNWNASRIRILFRKRKQEILRAIILLLRATKANLEGIANTYIRKAVKIEPLPIKMEIGDDIILVSELTVFSITLPVIMHFDPIVREDGNLTLKQSSVEIGNTTFLPQQ